MSYCAVFANRDYFCKKVLKNPHVLASTEILDEKFDQAYFKAVATRKNGFIFVAIAAIVITTFAAISLSAYLNNRGSFGEISADIPKVCSGHDNCLKFIETTTKKINESKRPEKEYRKNYKLACAYAIMGNKNSAIKHFDLAIEQNPDFTQALFSRASYLYDNQNYTAAAEGYKQILATTEREKYVHYYLGQTYYKMKDYQSAAESLLYATQNYPKNPEYAEDLAHAMLRTNDREGAIVYFEKAAKLYRKQSAKKNILKIRSLERLIDDLKKRAPLP
ncbi:hypothetical protein tpqmel_0491 [Candidatus Gastranaerophilus sp. (ex Termes propinquus)]|nr:hypothetical protein tpqmel_0491 [Candidatus Gastranaerophilus sp. (ex Termes propinquus)]